MAHVETVQTESDIQAVKGMVWEFFDLMKLRYPDMVEEIDAYIEDQDVAGQLDRFEETFLMPKGQCFIARADGAAVGMVMLKRQDDENAELNRMYVREAARGLGLGRKLGESLLAEARAMGFKMVWLDGLYRHVEALPLYESLGFEYYTDPNAFGGDDARIIHMKLAL